MKISYDVTSCAKLKCIVGYLNFGFEVSFSDWMFHDKYETSGEYN